MLNVQIATVLLALSSSYTLVLAADAPMITAAAKLLPRQNDPLLVGYISGSGGYSNARSCDLTETVSTSGSYFQCCPSSGACPFYTTCSANTLYAANGVTVDCYVNSGLACNTGLVLQSAGAAGGASYLACWQTSLGTGEFTFVQQTAAGGAGGAASTGSSGSSGSSGSAGSTAMATATSTGGSGAAASSTSSSSGGSSSGSASSSSATSASAANGGVESELGVVARLFGAAVAVVAPFLL